MLTAIESRIAEHPPRRVLVWLAAVLFVLTFCVPPWLGSALTWIMVIRYARLSAQIPALFNRTREIVGCATTRASEAEDGLRRAEAQIAALRAELADVRSQMQRAYSRVDDPTYRLVGLTPTSPNWLVVAARKAYRARLHPDRHPRHRQQAHERFVRAEAAFDTIYRLRGFTA